MNITVNGNRESVEPGTVLEFIMAKGLKPENVVIEHNRAIARRDTWAAIQLQEGDTLEVVTLVGGG